MVGILKEIQGMQVGFKGVRGLATEILAPLPLITPGIFFIDTPMAESEEVTIKPGGEVTATVTLPTDILADAHFTRIRAGLIPGKAPGTPAQLTQKSTITEEGGNPQTFNVDISLPATPASLSVLLPGGKPFWSFNQPMTESSYPFPELAEEVNTYLDRTLVEAGKVEVPIKLPFVIQSTGGGTAKVSIYGLAFVRLKTEKWENEMDGTIRLDRNLALEFGQVETIPLSPLDNAAGLTLEQIRMDVGGKFGPHRLLGRVEVPDGRESATISPEYSLAQGFRLENQVQAVGLTAPFSTKGEAEIYLEIQPDNNGMPASATPLAQAALKLSAPQGEAGKAGWEMANFQTAVELQAHQPYWLVLKGIRGQVLLPLKNQEDTYLSAILVNRGGQLWKPFQLSQSGAIPLIRLLYQPGLDNQTGAVVLRLQGSNVRQPLDPVAAGQPVNLKPPADAALPAVLIIESQAKGTLSLANLVQEYQGSAT